MNGMFKDCEGLASLDLSNFDTSRVMDRTHMFWDCNSLTGRCRTELRDFGFDLWSGELSIKIWDNVRIKTKKKNRKEDNLC